MDAKRRISRRQFLKGVVLGTGAVATPALLAACGSTPAAQNPTAAPPPAATAAQAAATAAPVAATAASAPAATAPAVAAKVEITHWDWFVSQGPALEEAITAFQAANPTITVKRTVNNVDNNNYANLFQLAAKGDSMPDVFMMPQSPTFQEQIASGWLADLTKMDGFADFKATYPKPDLNFLEGTNTIDGKTYTAPMFATDDAMWIQLWINTSVFKDAGIVDDKGNAKLPVTAEDVLAAAQAIKEKSGGQAYGYAFAAKSDNYHWPLWMAQLSGGVGGEGALDMRTGKYTLARTPAYRGVIDLIGKLRDDGHMLPDSGSIDDEALRVLFAQNKFGMYLNGSWVVNSFKKAAPDFKDFTVTHVPFFGAKEAQSFFYSAPGGGSFSVAATSKHQEAAWEWYRFLHSPEAGAYWVKGGNGRSVFPAANKPEYFTDEALKTLATIGPEYTRVGPSPQVRNPDTGKVKITTPKPSVREVMQGIYTGQITDIAGALEELDAAWTKSREQAIADAVKAGAKVSVEDWIFADWDPTKDYVTKQA